MTCNVGKYEVLLFALLLLAGGNSCVERSVARLPEESMPDRQMEMKLDVRTEGVSFVDGDTIGLFAACKGAESTLIENSPLAYVNGKWQSQEPLLWDDWAAETDIYAYYPYDGSVANASEMRVELPADQSQTADGHGCDFRIGSVCGVAPTEDTVYIELKPAMSKVIFEIAAGEGVTREELTATELTLRINNIKTLGVINLKTGEVIADGETVSVIPCRMDELRYRVYIVPQSIGPCKFVEIEYGNSYVVLERSFSCLGGESYICELTLNRNKNGINVGVGSWDRVDDDFGGTVK